LKAAYRARLEKLDWMGPKTKPEALKKLDTYTIKVAGPDHPRDYSKLLITDDDLVGTCAARAPRTGRSIRAVCLARGPQRLEHDAANQRRL